MCKIVNMLSENLLILAIQSDILSNRFNVRSIVFFRLDKIDVVPPLVNHGGHIFW